MGSDRSGPVGVERHRVVKLDGADPRLVLGAFHPFGSDPTSRWWPDAFARAVHTPLGPATVRFRWNPAGEAEATAWGGADAADWLLASAPRWLGVGDDRSGWEPARHPVVAELDRRHPGLRVGASAMVWTELAPIVLGQRVTTEDAARSWRRMVAAWGAAAPGPAELELRLGPAPDDVAGRSYVELHRFDVERRRADSLVLAARRAGRLEEAATMTPQAALARIGALAGLGPWTATSTVIACHGDPDTVLLGDFWMPTLVSHAFTGERTRVDDARMLDLLAPFAGHRWRVCRLVLAAGMKLGRRAPRPALHRIASI